MGEAVDLVAKGTAPMVPQPAEGATYDPLLNKKELQKIDWTKPAKEIHDFIRGLDSTPGAWTTLNGEEVRLFGSSLWSDKQPEIEKTVDLDERKGIVHQGGLLIEAVDGRFVNVKRIKIGTKTIHASKYGQANDSKIVEFTEKELNTIDGLRRIWTDILRININDDTDFFASGIYMYKLKDFFENFAPNLYLYLNYKFLYHWIPSVKYTCYIFVKKIEDLYMLYKKLILNFLRHF